MIMAQQALTTQVACCGPVHPRRRAVAPLDHLRPARAALRPAGTAGPRLPRRAERGVRRSRRGGDRQRQLPRAQPDRRHRRIRDAGAARRARARRCCGSRASAPAEPSCGWPTNGRSATTWCRASPRRPTSAGRSGIRVVAGVPVALCSDGEVDDARAYASEVLGHADFSPNYVRLLEHGDAEDVGDTMAAGDESTVLARLRRYRDAGVTDLAARVVPLGDDATQRSASRRRTQEFVASLVSEFASGRIAPMNSMGTPAIVQKNSSTPGTPGVDRRHVAGERLRLLANTAEVLGQERQAGEPLRARRRAGAPARRAPRRVRRRRCRAWSDPRHRRVANRASAPALDRAPAIGTGHPCR